MTRPEAMLFARAHFGAMTAVDIATHLAEHGVPVSSRTVGRWADPDRARAAEHAQVDRRRMRRRGQRVFGRMQALSALGLGAYVIAKVLTPELGFRVTERQVRYALAKGRVPHTLERLIDGAAIPREDDPDVQQWIAQGLIAS